MHEDRLGGRGGPRRAGLRHLCGEGRRLSFLFLPGNLLRSAHG